ncbi:ABC transporter permease DevC, partial [Anabaena sp. UHCC 0399]|uniref:ABC transporter permease DevC n=1 Tax=Anabaena sp. UHCC 0399 TaxID=3110238 RepID=UPI002B1F55B6
DGAVQLHNSLEGEIVLVSSRYKALISLDQFSQRRLYQALGFTGVQSVSPIYLDSVPWKNPDNQQTWQIFAIGFNPEEKVVNLPGVQENLNFLREPDTVLFDRGSRQEFGTIVSQFEGEKQVTTELNNRQVNVVGLFGLGTSFGINGNIITSDVNFLRLFSNKRRQQGLIDFGLIKLEPGADINWVIANLKANLPTDVKVLSKQELIAQEKSFWNTSTPVGFTFTLGAIIGFIVGAVIVYQILYSDVSDHLPEYATLKAIGFKNRYLLVIVFQEALILAAIGFIPGIAISQGLYMITRQATLLPIMMTLDRAIFIFILTTLMCTISASIAMRKLQAADPADIF